MGNKIRIIIEVTHEDGSVETAHQRVDYPVNKGRTRLALNLGKELAQDLEAKLRFEDIWDQLPKPPDLAAQSQQDRRVRSHEDLINQLNADQAWFEISNSLTNATFDLGHAKAYRDSEPPGGAQEYFYCHDLKM